MQEVLAYRAGSLHLESVGRREGVHTDELDYFIERSFVGKQSHEPCAKRSPLIRDILVEPASERVGIEGIARQPVYRREVALICERRVESPEDLYYSEGRLGDGLRNIAAGRRNSAYDRERALASVRAEGNNTSRTLIELGKSAAEISGVALFAGHLFKSAGHLAQSLRPAGGRVRHEGDGIAHVSEIFRYRDARIYRRFTRGDGHI